MKKSLIKMKLHKVETAMRSAAIAEDFEKALELREEVRSLRQALIEAPEPEMKVVNLFTREEYIPDDEDSDDEEDIASILEDLDALNDDDDSALVIRQALDLLEEGKIKSVLMMYQTTDNELLTVDYSDGVLDSVSKYIATLYTFTHHFAHMTEDMAEIEEYEEDE